jgi:hypothetical protein
MFQDFLTYTRKTIEREAPRSVQIMRPLRAGILALLCLSTNVVLAQTRIPQAPSERTRQENDIREAIFRYRMSESKFESIFLAVDGRDPNDNFMKRFTKSTVPVKKASQAGVGKKRWPGYLIDPATDERAIQFSVGSIKWVSDTQVEVRGGMYCGSLCADAGIYRVTKRSDRWEVEKYDMQMIS